MKSLFLFSLFVIGASATLNLNDAPMDGHKNLHAAMVSILHQLHGSKFPVEMQAQLNRTQRVLIARIHPYLTRVGIRIRNPQAYHSLLRHLLYAQSRNFVNTSKALDNIAQTSVLALHKAHMLNKLIEVHKLQRNLAVFFNELHNHISQEAQVLLRKHRVHIGMPHVHFLIHISARALIRGEKVHEVIAEHLRVVVDKKMSVDQRRRLEKAGVELALKIQTEVRQQLQYQLKKFLAKETPVAATHPIFMHNAMHHFKPLMHHCHKGMHHLLGRRYEHYQQLAKMAFGPNVSHEFMHRLHGYAGPIALEHMNRVAVILRRHHQKPQHSVIGYLGAYHLRPDLEPARPWYNCFLGRLRGLIRVAWLVFAIVLGGALLGTAIMVILSKRRVKKVVVKKAPSKSENGSKLPYVSLVEEKVPIEA